MFAPQADSCSAALICRHAYLGMYRQSYISVGARTQVALGEGLSCSTWTGEILADSWFNPDISLLTRFGCSRAVLTVVLLLLITSFKCLCGAVLGCGGGGIREDTPLCEPVKGESLTPWCCYVHGFCILRKRLFRLVIDKLSVFESSVCLQQACMDGGANLSILLLHWGSLSILQCG